MTKKLVIVENIKSYKYKLTLNDYSYWGHILQLQQDCCNYLYLEVYHDLKIDTKIKKGKEFLYLKSTPNYVQIHNKYYKKLRSMFPDLGSQKVIKCEQEVAATYKTIKNNPKTHGRIVNIPVKKGYSLQLDKRLYGKLENDKIRFNKELSGSFDLWNPEMWIYEKLDPKIQKENGQYWLIIPYKLPKILPTNDNTMGVDLGLRVMATTSTGKGFKGNDYKHRRREIRYLKDILKSKADKGSRTAKKHLKKLSHKERNFTKNYIHLLSNALIKEAKDNNKDVIILEDLSFDPKKSSRGSNRRRSQMPYFEIKQTITYKALSTGIRTETVNPAYTSQTNYLTGLVEGTRLGRMFKEPEGRILDADWNAALNISGSPFFLTKVIPISGKLQIEDRLLSTNHTIITSNSIYQAPCL